MNFEKLKDSARKFEQKEDWRKAIEVYLKAIQQIESGAEASPDLSLYNRIGDLYLRINDTAAAVRSYERAVDLYADQGFFNNAIALCGKILRVNPGRTQTYLKVAQLHARKNVVIEAKRNLIEFLERMNAIGQLDEALESVKQFADRFSGGQEIRMMLVELVRAVSREDATRGSLEGAAGEGQSRGDSGGAGGSRGQGSASEQEAVPGQPDGGHSRGVDLVFLDTGFASPPAEPMEPAKALETASAEEAGTAAPRPPDGLMVIEGLPAGPPAAASIEGLERGGSEGGDLELVPPADPASADLELGGLELTPSEPFALGSDGGPDTGYDVPMLEGMEETSVASDGFPPPTELVTEIELTDPAALDIRQEPGGFADPAEATANAMTGPAGEVTEPAVAGEAAREGAVAEVETAGDSEGASELEFIAVDAEPASVVELGPDASGAPSIGELESRVLDDPGNPGHHEELASALHAAGEGERAVEELDLALAAYEARQEWEPAARIADRLVGAAPYNIRFHQKRVELAYRMGDRGPLIEAYLALGDALDAVGATDKAVAVYGRVQEHEPDNARAAAALQRLRGEPPQQPTSPPEAAAPAAPEAAPESAAEAAPEPPAAAAPPAAEPSAAAPTHRATGADGGFVDLGSLVLEDGPRDTRMRVERHEPADDDEQREFAEILEQFKRGIEQNLDTEDYQAHYDLGVAFKEMGLLDEAIAEFQKALRSPEIPARLRTSEALGAAFYDKAQYAVAEAILTRAVDGLESADDAKIGLIYWRGRAAEAQGKHAEAIANYERALAVDIRFMDLGERIHRLTAGRHP